jgi:hypothetical protein
MTNREFYKRLAKEIKENVHPTVADSVRNLEITSLHQVLGIVRSIMIRNNQNLDEAMALKKELKALCNILDISEKELE